MVGQVKLKFEMKIKRAVTITGTLYKTTTLMEAFYFGGMAESILSGVTIGDWQDCLQQTHGKHSRFETNAECRELSMQNGKCWVSLLHCTS